MVANFVVQYGDPRGDGEGGPGYTIRDELNHRPYLRGTVGMALSGRDTGGSQFFITHSPQPHLDANYTVFGHVVNGIEFLDRIKPGDVIQRIRVWDGKGWVECAEVTRAGLIHGAPCGGTVHRRLSVRGGLPLLAALLLPPLAFFAIGLSPLSLVGFVREGLSLDCSAAASARRPASVSTPSPLCRNFRVTAEGVQQ